jgi:hypothetical protein
MVQVQAEAWVKAKAGRINVYFMIDDYFAEEIDLR